MNEDIILDKDSALTAMGNDVEIYEEVLAVFLEDTPKIIQDLETAFNESDSETMHRLAHSLKSSSRTIGGNTFSAAAETLEKNDFSNSAEVKKLIDEIKSHFDELYALCSISEP